MHPDKPINPYAVVDNKLCAETLVYVNELLTNHGGEPQSHLADGYVCNSRACPISSTLRVGFGDKLALVSDIPLCTGPGAVYFDLIDETEPRGFKEYAFTVPPHVTDFVRAFDSYRPDRETL